MASNNESFNILCVHDDDQSSREVRVMDNGSFKCSIEMLHCRTAAALYIVQGSQAAPTLGA